MKTKFLNEALIFSCICVLLHRHILLSLVRRKFLKKSFMTSRKVLIPIFCSCKSPSSLVFVAWSSASPLFQSNRWPPFVCRILLRACSSPAQIKQKWYSIFISDADEVFLFALTKQDQLHLEQPWSIAACTHALQRAFPAPLPRQSGDTYRSSM